MLNAIRFVTRRAAALPCPAELVSSVRYVGNGGMGPVLAPCSASSGAARWMHGTPVPPAHSPTASANEPYSSAGPAGGRVDAARRATISRLVYRSKQRGFLELDILVGGWSERNVEKLNGAELDALSKLLDQENPDMFKWLTGQLEAPPDMLANSVFRAIRDSVALNMKAHSQQKALAPKGAIWRRGWDDSGMPAPSPQAAKTS